MSTSIQKDKLKILVVDDSPVYLRFLSQILAELPETAAVETAASGEEGLVKTGMFNPDLILLDYRLPKMDGLAALTRIKVRKPDTVVVILSSASSQAAAITVEALKLGALEFLAKPNMATCDNPEEYLRGRLRKIISVVLAANYDESLGASKGSGKLKKQNRGQHRDMTDEASLPPVAGVQRTAPTPGSIEAVAVGISTGGPAALHQLIPTLPAELACPIFIVQHMPAHFTGELARSLDKEAALTVVEAHHGQQVQNGYVYIAPGGRHLRLLRQGEQTSIEITDEEPELFCRPSVNKLFRDVGEFYGRNALGIIMTGMGKDGLEGLREMHGHGSYLMGQSEESSLIYSMPFYPAQAGLLHETHNPAGLAQRIMTLGGHKQTDQRTAPGAKQEHGSTA